MFSHKKNSNKMIINKIKSIIILKLNKKSQIQIKKNKIFK